MDFLNLQKKNCILNFVLRQEAPDEAERYLKMIQSSSSDNCVDRYNIEILNLFYPKLQLIYIKPMTDDKLKEFLSEIKKLKFNQH